MVIFVFVFFLLLHLQKKESIFLFTIKCLVTIKKCVLSIFWLMKKIVGIFSYFGYLGFYNFFFSNEFDLEIIHSVNCWLLTKFRLQSNHRKLWLMDFCLTESWHIPHFTFFLLILPFTFLALPSQFQTFVLCCLWKWTCWMWTISFFFHYEQISCFCRYLQSILTIAIGGWASLRWIS